ncbi:universal stress protein UspA [Prosthecochloris sp. GSB1]|uniref:universal stress protein n=1 Tax=Prosthecochloris sp. GSB1 TaxID=281093 RepID=UPI000B8CBD5E|nr:universal stress protein [Prosthecochloris sp. GSB1]ASQ91400.1 universal stress protein UspA [Prosthecochloris sp. GSB1]
MKILAALDFTVITETVVAATKKIAGESSATVLLLHVLAEESQGMEFHPTIEPHYHRPEKYYREADSSEEGDTVPLLHDKRLRELQDLADILRQAGIETAVSLVHGDPVATVLERAEREQSDLIVVGSHGHKTIHQFLKGSVCAGLVRQANVPVVIVPQKVSG